MSEFQKTSTVANPVANSMESAGGMTKTPPAFSLTANPLQLAENENAPASEETLLTETLTYEGYTATQSATNANLFSVSQGATVTQANVNLTTARSFMIGRSTAGQWDSDVSYNYNTAVRICEYVSQHVAGVDYSVSTDLEGTSDDDVKIVSDKVIMGIALLQAANGMAVDGKPGGSFIKTVIGSYQNQTDDQARLNYMNEETTNTSMTRADNTTIEIPDFGTANEATLYDFFRDITMARNGLWSDNAEITNIVSLRRTLDPVSSADWNDTFAVAWVEGEGDAQVKHCKTYIGSTEPGNGAANSHIQPQTILTTLGLHKSRQAGGRNSHILVQNADDTMEFDQSSTASGFNFHPGGMSGLRGGMTVGENSELANVPGAYGAQNESHFQFQHKLGEVFYILGNWGKDRNHAAYYYLEQANDAAVALQNAPVEGQTPDTQAITDFARITTLLDELKTALEDANMSSNQVTAKINYLKQTIEFSRDGEADVFDNGTTDNPLVDLNDGSEEVNANVSSSSEGCQNVFGGDAFYDYWWNMQQFADDSGQRRWYYNMIDLTTNYNAIQTQTGGQ